jgi:hypothetical protein
MFGPLFLVVGHFDFDDAWIDASVFGRQGSGTDLRQQSVRSSTGPLSWWVVISSLSIPISQR